MKCDRLATTRERTSEISKEPASTRRGRELMYPTRLATWRSSKSSSPSRRTSSSSFAGAGRSVTALDPDQDLLDLAGDRLGDQHRAAPDDEDLVAGVPFAEEDLVPAKRTLAHVYGERSQVQLVERLEQTNVAQECEGCGGRQHARGPELRWPRGGSG